MISDELRNILDKITKQGKMRFLEGATEEQILAFENTNGITLPTQYKEWLCAFLESNIKLHKNQATFAEAVGKWMSDLTFLKEVL